MWRVHAVIVGGAWILLQPAVAGQSNVDVMAPYAWGENIGWCTFHPDSANGAVVTSAAVSGFVWCENVGWVNLGDGANSDPGE